jgi:hypothetical protein
MSAYISAVAPQPDATNSTPITLNRRHFITLLTASPLVPLAPARAAEPAFGMVERDGWILNRDDK